MSMTRDLVAANVRAEMARNQIRQAEMAKRLGRSQVWVSRRLTGSVEFNTSELVEVAGVLGVSASLLLGEAAA